LEINSEQELFIYSKKLPKEYLFFNLKMILNKELYESKIISFEVFNKMEQLLIEKMNEMIVSIK